MKKYKIVSFVFVIIATFIIKLNYASARDFQANFLGCSNIDCENAGYNNNGKWEGIDCDYEVYLNFPANSDLHSSVILPSCHDAGFNGWIMKMSGSHTNYATFCDDSDTPSNHIKLYGNCKKPHVFEKNFDYSIDDAYRAGYSEFSFDAKINDKKPSEYGSSSSIVSHNNGQGTDEGNYDEGNIVSCGPNLLKDIPGILPSTIHIIYLVLQLAVPIILVILGIIDFIKSMVNSKEDEIKKGQKTFISRIIAGVLIFFVFSIVKLVISLVADNSTKILNCAECFISDNDKCIR